MSQPSAAPPNLPFRQNQHFEPVLKSSRVNKDGQKDESGGVSSRASKKDQTPMMYVDVFIDSEGEPIKHRIPVFRGD